jgi:serine protease
LLLTSIIRNRRLAAATIAAVTLPASGAAMPVVARAADYVPHEVVVGYAAPPPPNLAADTASEVSARATAPAPSPTARVLRLPKGLSVGGAIARLRRKPGVAYAVPNYIAHAAGSWIPNDPGRTHRPEGWELLQWNFLAGAGVNAPEAWANLISEHRAGGRGVVVAILDTGVAYRNWGRFRKSPDFARTRFFRPYDFVANNRFPLDRDGHGTFVAGTIAEATNNRFGLTGLAYGASIMPVRVLDSAGNGDASTISRGIRYAATHGAKVINLSLVFDPGTTAGDIPDIISATNFAERRGAVVVGASGNDSTQEVAYPARDRGVISVGATTADRCLAEYSNGGRRLDLVAPGGGDDADLPDVPNCHPARSLPDIFQMTFGDPSRPGRFGFPGGWYGTSMSAAHVAAAAALVIASGVVGHNPSPARVLTRLEQTASPLGSAKPSDEYGYGLLDAGAATAR